MRYVGYLQYLCIQLNKRDMATTRPNFWLAILLFLLPTAARGGTADTIPSGCPIVKMEVEQLPDLNIARAGHQVFCVNGEYVVAGGHTDGFVPTPTAEYFKDGEWHVMQMTYSHDVGFSARLKSGKVLIAGGCEQPSGIGQTYNAELYDPETHSFRGFGILQRKRTWASALELDSGEVVIAGNWYHNDGIEMFYEAQSAKGDHRYRQSFTYIRDVATQRSSPIIIRIAKDDALIFGPYGIRGDTVRTAYAYRLKGDSVHIPLFETWLPISAGCRQIDASFIGDEAKGDFTYLVPVKDSTGQVAIARFSGTEASLLPTACAIPMTYKGDSIIYCNITADRQSGRAYLFGLSKHFQTQQDNTYNYILCIDYAHASDKGAPMKLYYTDPLEMMPDFSPILTPEGHLLIAGGLRNGSNFTPAKNVYLLHVGQPKAVEARSAGRWWIWAGLALAGLCIVGIIMMLRRRKSCDTAMECAPVSDEPANELMSLINELMDKEKPYLNSELKVSDIADAFHLHRNDISACINSQMGCTFAQYINRYRIEYAKELMRRQPDKKISSIWMESGFGSEQTFFKTFRSATGLSPKEWYLQEND